jgi:hypothetical protein
MRDTHTSHDLTAHRIRAMILASMQSRNRRNTRSKHMAVFTRDISPPVNSTKTIAKGELEWITVNPDSLPKGLRVLHDEWREHDIAARDAKKAFTEAMRSCMDVPAGHNVVFGTGGRFAEPGQLSFAFAPVKAKAATKPVVDISKFMKRA